MNVQRQAMHKVFLYAAEFSLLGIENSHTACTTGALWLVEDYPEFPLGLQWNIRDACMTAKWNLFPEINFARSRGMANLRTRCEIHSTQFCMLASMTEDEEGWNIICSKITPKPASSFASF